MAVVMEGLLVSPRSHRSAGLLQSVQVILLQKAWPPNRALIFQKGLGLDVIKGISQSKERHTVD